MYYILGALGAKLNNEWYLSQNTCLVQPFQFFFIHISFIRFYFIYIWQEHNVWESIASTLAFDEKANRDKIFRCGGFHFIAWDFPFRNLFKPPNRKIKKKYNWGLYIALSNHWRKSFESTFYRIIVGNVFRFAWGHNHWHIKRIKKKIWQKLEWEKNYLLFGCVGCFCYCFFLFF